MNHLPFQAPRFGFCHRRLDLIEMMGINIRRLGRSGVQGVGGFQMHLHGRQRITTVCVQQECRRQVISDIGLVSDLPQVGLAGVSPVVELAPVVCQQDII